MTWKHLEYAQAPVPKFTGLTVLDRGNENIECWKLQSTSTTLGLTLLLAGPEQSSRDSEKVTCSDESGICRLGKGVGDCVHLPQGTLKAQEHSSTVSSIRLPSLDTLQCFVHQKLFLYSSCERGETEGKGTGCAGWAMHSPHSIWDV